MDTCDFNGVKIVQCLALLTSRSGWYSNLSGEEVRKGDDKGSVVGIRPFTIRDFAERQISRPRFNQATSNVSLFLSRFSQIRCTLMTELVEAITLLDIWSFPDWLECSLVKGVGIRQQATISLLLRRPTETFISLACSAWDCDARDDAML